MWSVNRKIRMTRSLFSSFWWKPTFCSSLSVTPSTVVVFLYQLLDTLIRLTFVKSFVKRFRFLPKDQLLQIIRSSSIKTLMGKLHPTGILSLILDSLLISKYIFCQLSIHKFISLLACLTPWMIISNLPGSVEIFCSQELKGHVNMLQLCSSVENPTGINFQIMRLEYQVITKWELIWEWIPFRFFGHLR